MIEVRELRKRFGGTQALDGFSLRVERGELFGLVGPNGAGKTTLIRILSTLSSPDGGSAAMDGHDVQRQPAAVRGLIGYMPDVPGLYQDMRVVEFLEFFADAYRLDRHRRAAALDRAFEISGLGPRRDAFVEQLSLGMKQRLVLARTLLHDPKILLLDEPATGLDPLARIDLRELLKSLNRSGVTILISSHILTDLEDICSRVALIASGRNAKGADGASVIDLRPGTAASVLSCELRFLGDADAAAQVAGTFAGVRLRDRAAGLLRLEIDGGPEQAAAFLRHVVTAGVQVTGFDTAGPALEERYRQAFGRPQ